MASNNSNTNASANSNNGASDTTSSTSTITPPNNSRNRNTIVADFELDSVFDDYDDGFTTEYRVVKNERGTRINTGEGNTSVSGEDVVPLGDIPVVPIVGNNNTIPTTSTSTVLDETILPEEDDEDLVILENFNGRRSVNPSNLSRLLESVEEKKPIVAVSSASLENSTPAKRPVAKKSPRTRINTTKAATTTTTSPTNTTNTTTTTTRNKENEPPPPINVPSQMGTEIRVYEDFLELNPGPGEEEEERGDLNNKTEREEEDDESPNKRPKKRPKADILIDLTEENSNDEIQREETRVSRSELDAENTEIKEEEREEEEEERGEALVAEGNVEGREDENSIELRADNVAILERNAESEEANNRREDVLQQQDWEEQNLDLTFLFDKNRKYAQRQTSERGVKKKDTWILRTPIPLSAKPSGLVALKKENKLFVKASKRGHIMSFVHLGPKQRFRIHIFAGHKERFIEIGALPLHFKTENISRTVTIQEDYYQSDPRCGHVDDETIIESLQRWKEEQVARTSRNATIVAAEEGVPVPDAPAAVAEAEQAGGAKRRRKSNDKRKEKVEKIHKIHLWCAPYIWEEDERRKDELEGSRGIRPRIVTMLRGSFPRLQLPKDIWGREPEGAGVAAFVRDYSFEMEKRNRPVVEHVAVMHKADTVAYPSEHGHSVEVKLFDEVVIVDTLQFPNQVTSHQLLERALKRQKYLARRKAEEAAEAANSINKEKSDKYSGHGLYDAVYALPCRITAHANYPASKVDFSTQMWSELWVDFSSDINLAALNSWIVKQDKDETRILDEPIDIWATHRLIGRENPGTALGRAGSDRSTMMVYEREAHYARRTAPVGVHERQEDSARRAAPASARRENREPLGANVPPGSDVLLDVQPGDGEIDELLRDADALIEELNPGPSEH